MAYLNELPLKPGVILQYIDEVTDRTVYYRVNLNGFLENYYYVDTLESSLSTILVDSLINDGWNVCFQPPMPGYAPKMIFKDKPSQQNVIMSEVVRDVIVDELTTPKSI